MKTEEIKERVAKINEMRGDFEAAHAEEDRLYLDFIKSIARLPTRWGRKAQEVLKTQNIDFIRVTA